MNFINRNNKEFLSQASGYTRIAEIRKLWQDFALENAMIEQKINEAFQTERMCGSNPSSTKKLLDDIMMLFESH